MTRLKLATHPSDAQLARLLDRQADSRGLKPLEDHLARCHACVLRVEELDAASRRVRGAVDALSTRRPEASRRALTLSAIHRAQRRRPRVTLRRFPVAAVIATLLLLSAFTARPSRAWIASAVDRVVVGMGLPSLAEWLSLSSGSGRGGALSSGSAAAALPVVVNGGVAGGNAQPPLRPPLPVLAAQTGAVSFSPEGEEMLLEVASYQREGTLSLWITDAADANARVSGEGKGEGFHVMRSGVRILNAGGSTARYEIVVPRGVRNVRIRIAGDPKAWIGIEPSSSGQPWLWTVDLKQRRAR